MSNNFKIRLDSFATGVVAQVDGDGVVRDFLRHPVKQFAMRLETFEKAAAIAGRVLDANAHVVAQVRALNAATGNLARYGVSIARRAE